MKTQIIIALLALTLTACTPEFIPAPSATPVPTATSTPPPPTSTPRLELTFAPATPIPTMPPPPILTPDAIQVERWQEYQTELAKVLLRGYGPDAYKDALCEWDILGRSGQEAYVWAYCVIRGGPGDDGAAVVYFEADGSIQKVKQGIKLPTDVLEKIHKYYILGNPYEGRREVLRLHLIYREAQTEEPPLVVLSAMPTATLTPY